MLNIIDSYFSYVLVMIRQSEVPLFSMTVYMMTQKQHRIKKITHLHELCFNIFIMHSIWDQKSAGYP